MCNTNKKRRKTKDKPKHPKPAGLAEKILRLGRALPAVNLRKFAVLSDLRLYKTLRYKGFKLRSLDESMEKEFLEKICRQNFCDDGQNICLQSSNTTSVVLFSHGNKKYVKKFFYHRSIFDSIKDLIRGPRAFRSLEGDLLLRKFGFNAPFCLLAGKKGRLSFTVCEYIEDALDLQSLIKEKLDFPLDKQKIDLKRQIALRAGHVVGKLHAQGIVPGDLRLGNILVGRDSGGRLQMWILDNERTFYFGKIPEKLRIKNLVQINMIPVETISDADRARFFLEYLKETPGLSIHRKSLAARVVEKTTMRMKKHSGNSRPQTKKRN